MKKLSEYRRKRSFDKTPEPPGSSEAHKDEKIFVVQKHAATRLHYDLRLEVAGVLKSWAVPKGPSLNPGDKRLAIHVEDHPFEYRTFEGTIPSGQYGAGEVIIWDQGTYEPEGTASAREQLERGELKFRLFGQKLRGSFVLVRLKRSAKQNEWLLIKHRDDHADPNWDVEKHSESVVSGRHLGNVNRRQLVSGAKEGPDPSRLPGAEKAAMPQDASVTLARLAEKPFSDPNWLFEIKWDGVRTVAFVEPGKVRLMSRSGRDVTAENPEFHDLDNRLNAKSVILDGEIVTLDKNGRSDFQKLQNRLGVRNPSQQLRESIPLTYYLFDVLYCDGFDVRKSPLLARKELLRNLLRREDGLRYSGHQLEKGKELFQAAKEQQLEGIIGKQIESPYPGNRTPLWLKFKIVKELDAVVAGWTAPRRTRQYFGALVLGLYEGKEMKFIGSVGTGFNQAGQKEILEKLKELRTGKAAFRSVPKLREKVEWVQPEMVTRVKYGNWTEDRHLRAPVFLSVRKDIAPKDCTFDAAQPEVETEKPSAITKRSSEKNPAISRKHNPEIHADKVLEELANGKSESLRLEIDGRALNFTHLNKIYFPESGIRKRDLLAYYYRFARYILPFLKERPLVLRRYPDGIEGESFFQKETPKGVPDWIPRATIHSEERGGNMHYVMASDRPAVLFLTNLGCIDHNPWSSRVENLDYPDYVFFDLDPTPDTPFSTVLRVARSIHKILKSIHMDFFMKTSGATGFHIFVPLKPVYKYEQTRTFAQIIGELVVREHPSETTTERTVSKRPKGRVMIDALQNAKGKPLAAVYSARAHPGATVSAPVTDGELAEGFDPAEFHIKTMTKRIEKAGDLWKDFWKKRQTLNQALELLSKTASLAK